MGLISRVSSRTYRHLVVSKLLFLGIKPNFLSLVFSVFLLSFSMPPKGKKRGAAKKAQAAKAPVAKVEKEPEVIEEVEEETPQVEEKEMDVSHVTDTQENEDNEPEEDDEEAEGEEEANEEETEDVKEENGEAKENGSAKKKKEKRERPPPTRLHNFEELGNRMLKDIAHHYRNANKMTRGPLKFPPMKNKRFNRTKGTQDTQKRLNHQEMEVFKKYTSTLGMDCAVVWGDKHQFRVCSSQVLSAHCQKMKVAINRARENIIKGANALPEKSHVIVLKVHDELSSSIVQILSWMHTGELHLSKTNFEKIVNGAVALRVFDLTDKLKEVASEYGFHWVPLPKSEKQKKRKAKEEAKKAEENGDAEEKEEDEEQETEEPEAAEEEQYVYTLKEIDPSLTKIGGQDLFDKIKGWHKHNVSFIYEFPEDSKVKLNLIDKYAKKHEQRQLAGQKRRHHNNDKNDANKKKRTESFKKESAPTTSKGDWKSRTGNSAPRQQNRTPNRSTASGSIYRAQPTAYGQQPPPMQHPMMNYQPPMQQPYYGQHPQQYQYPPQPQYQQPPQPTWR